MYLDHLKFWILFCLGIIFNAFLSKRNNKFFLCCWVVFFIFEIWFHNIGTKKFTCMLTLLLNVFISRTIYITEISILFIFRAVNINNALSQYWHWKYMWCSLSFEILKILFVFALLFLFHQFKRNLLLFFHCWATGLICKTHFHNKSSITCILTSVILFDSAMSFSYQFSISLSKWIHT